LPSAFLSLKLNTVSVNLLEIIQSQLGYPELQKMDPNKQAVVTEHNIPYEHRFSQAAIPGILTALYMYSRTDDGAENILNGTSTVLWTDVIFGNRKKEVLQKIADYSSYSKENAEIKMNRIAIYAVKTIQTNLPPEASIRDVKKILADQSAHVLLYIPADLQMGEILNEGTLDDPTNKMEGPVSNMMHAIGNQFSNNGVNKEDIHNES
jgi:hypothetical protein